MIYACLSGSAVFQHPLHPTGLHCILLACTRTLTLALTCESASMSAHIISRSHSIPDAASSPKPRPPKLY